MKISNVYAEITADKPDVGYEYEGPIEDNPRNLSPAIMIAGLKDAVIESVSFENVVIKHGGGANLHYANVPLDSLNLIPELPQKYPDFSMFKELPSWAVFIRHGKDIHFNESVFSTDEHDFRKSVVVDNATNITFTDTQVNGKVDKESFFDANSTKVMFN